MYALYLLVLSECMLSSFSPLSVPSRGTHSYNYLTIPSGSIPLSKRRLTNSCHLSSQLGHIHNYCLSQLSYRQVAVLQHLGVHVSILELRHSVLVVSPGGFIITSQFREYHPQFQLGSSSAVRRMDESRQQPWLCLWSFWAQRLHVSSPVSPQHSKGCHAISFWLNLLPRFCFLQYAIIPVPLPQDF